MCAVADGATVGAMVIAPTLTRRRTAQARALLARARHEGFAVGAFNVDNFETLLGVCRAAAATSAPVLVEVSHAEVEVLGLANVRSVLDNTTAELGVEAYLNLDHAPTVDDCLAAIDAGFEFVHLDLFQRRPDATEAEVVAETRRVAAAAARSGAVVEGEQLALPGRSTVHSGDAAASGLRSTPDGARRFVEATGIDVYAAAIGNVHGRYARPAPVDLDLLASLHEAVDVPLSLHGGSGLPDDIARTAVRRGVVKININSDVRYAYRTALQRQLDANPDEYATVKLMEPVIAAVQAEVQAKIRAFGSVDMASR